MPNWCENRMIIKGKKEEIDRFLKEAKGEGEDKNLPVSLGKLVPVPKELLDGEDGYHWRLAHWGSKWDLCECIITSRKDYKNGISKVEIDYETAWSPISEGLCKISEIFPQLEFFHKYIEEGVGFAGYQNFRAGRMLDELSLTETEPGTNAYRSIKRSIGWN